MMIWRVTLTAFLAVLLAACGPLPADDGERPTQTTGKSVESSVSAYVPGELLVGIEVGGAVHSNRLSAAARSAAEISPAVLIPGARIVDTLTFPPPTSTAMRAATLGASQEIAVLRIALPAGMSVEAARTRLLESGGVVYAEPNRIVRRAVLPDDPHFAKQWGLNNSGQTISGNMGVLTGTPGVDIAAANAWEIRSGSEVVVAMLDSGVDLQHPDLQANIWTNAQEQAGDGNHDGYPGIGGIDDDGDGLIDEDAFGRSRFLADGVTPNGLWRTGGADALLADDDENGYKDDLQGWNFVYNSALPQDDDVDGHGTHTAGTVGALGNNTIGVTGVGWSARLMVLKFLDSGGGGTIFDAAAGIRYAANNGARIVNASYTYPQSCVQTSPDNTERLAIDYARQKGVLIVAAAGNYGCNNNNTPFYPASHNLANILSVAATDSLDRLASWNGVGSNYGSTSVDLGAPGHNIYSTLPRTMRGEESGGVSGYGYLSGTSMAAPMVSGAASLLWSQNPDWTYSEVRDALLASVDPVPALTNKTISGGRLNLARALALGNVMPAPTGLAAAATAPGTVTLSWQDNAGSETGYLVERARDDGDFVALILLAANATSHTDSAAPDGSRLRYRVKALDAEHRSSPYSNEGTAIVPLFPPTGLTAAIDDSAGIRLSWSDNSGSEEAFFIERRAETAPAFSPLASTAPDVTHYDDLSAVTGTLYHYRVRASNSISGFSDYATGEGIALIAPEPPSELAIAAVAPGAVSLSWKHDSANATGYVIERAPEGGVFVPLVQLPAAATSYTDSAAPDGSRMNYRVKAMGGYLSSPYSAEVTATVPLFAPTILSVMAGSTTGIRLSWSDNSNNEEGFVVERRADREADFREVFRSGPDVTRYDDAATVNGTRYHYRVLAFNGSSGLSAASNVETFSLPLPPPSGLDVAPDDAVGLRLSWSDNSSSEESFSVERRTEGEATFGVLTNTAADVTLYADRTALAGTRYYYRVRAFNSGSGFSDYSDEASGFRVPSAGNAGSSRCFIATAAWGSPWSREVTSLRRFRDRVLLQSAPGRLLVACYYRLSPPVARLLAGHESARAAVRWLLTPLVSLADWLAPVEASAMGTRPAETPARQAVPHELLVKFRPGTSAPLIEERIAANGGKILERLELGSGIVYRLALPAQLDVDTVQKAFAAFPEVEYAEPNRTVGIELPGHRQ